MEIKTSYEILSDIDNSSHKKKWVALKDLLKEIDDCILDYNLDDHQAIRNLCVLLEDMKKER